MAEDNHIGTYYVSDDPKYFFLESLYVSSHYSNMKVMVAALDDYTVHRATYENYTHFVKSCTLICIKIPRYFNNLYGLDDA